MITLTEKMIEFIYYVQRSTDSNLRWVRKARAPHFHLYNIQQVRAYKFKGETIPVTDGTIFYVTDLPFFAASNHDPMWVKPFADCVKENLVPPMIMFRQHKGNDRLIPIPWEELFIVKNYNYCYIIIDGLYNDIENMGAIVSPRRTLYSHTFQHEPELGMVFNAQGQLLCEDMISPTNKIEQGYQVFADDIIVYKLRRFEAGEKGFIIERPIQKEKVFIDDLIVTYDDYIVLDPSVYIEYLESNAFRFKPGVDPTRLKVGVMYYESGNLSLDRQRRRLTPEQMKNNALDDIDGNATPAYQNIKPPLDLDDDPTLIDKWYAIMAWDKDLYKEITGEEPPEDDGVLRDPTKRLRYTGEEIKDLTVDDEAVIENWRWKDDHFINSDVEISGFCRAMVFQNGELVSSIVTTTASAISFPTLGLTIEDDDIFEVVLMAYDEEEQEGVYPNITLKDFEKSEQDLATDFGLHAHNLITFEAVAKEDGEFDFSNIDRGMLQYKIQCKNEPFTDVVGDGLFKCKLNALDDYYKDKVLDVRFTARNRFAFQQVIVDGDDDTIEYNLSEQFKYCHELNHYYVAINGRRIDYKYLKLVHPKHNNAFYEFKLFCQVPTHKGDVVHIYYLPFEMVEVCQKDIIDKGGCVTVTGMPAHYAADDYWVFCNGKKILEEKIQMPSDDTFAIIDPNASNKNFTVLFIRSYINGTPETWFTPASDAYTGMSDADIAATCGLAGIDEDAVSIYDDCYDRESILKYVISQYYSVSNDTTYMTYEEVYREDENEMLAALSTRKDAADNAYSVYKVGSYDSPNDEQNLPPESVPLS